jgi:membrane associated rhomboid family serine protease
MVLSQGTEIFHQGKNFSDVAAGKLNMILNIPTVGASGAVFGILLGFGMLFPNTELMLLFPPIPIKAKYFVLGYGAIELFSGITGSGSNIAHFAHLGGMLFGFILIKYWNTKTKNFY